MSQTTPDLEKDEDDKTTLDQKWLTKLKNNKLIAALIIIGIAVAALASFSDNAATLFGNIKKLMPVETETSVISSNTDTGIPTGADTNIHATENASDVITMTRADVNVNIGINNKEGNLQYAITRNADGGYTISPQNDYLSLLQNRGPIEPKDFWYSIFDYQFPNFDFKITNNTGKTIFFTQAIFKIKKSLTDLYPILLIQGQSYSMHLPLSNIGWGTVSNCKIRFNISAQNLPAGTYDYAGTTYKYNLAVPDFEQYPNTISFAPALQHEGVDTLTLINRYSSSSFGPEGETYTIRNTDGTEQTITGEEYKARMQKAAGPFKDNMAYVYGVINYTAKNAYKQPVQASMKFKALVNLGERGAGAPMPPSFYYKLMLALDKDNYSRTVNISQAIKTGDYDRFNISVAAPKSSVHDFDLILVYDDNQQITIPNIRLNYFMSRLDSNYIGDEKNRRPE